jgi:hypothetical protein
VLKGYQADMDFTSGYMGNLYEELRRLPGHMVLAPGGRVACITDGRYKTGAATGEATLQRGQRRHIPPNAAIPETSRSSHLSRTLAAQSGISYLLETKALCRKICVQI